MAYHGAAGFVRPTTMRSPCSPTSSPAVAARGSTRHIVRQKQLATSVNAGIAEQRGPALFQISATPTPTSAIADLEAAVDAEIERVKAGPISDWEMEKARDIGARSLVSIDRQLAQSRHQFSRRTRCSTTIRRRIETRRRSRREGDGVPTCSASPASTWSRRIAPLCITMPKAAAPRREVNDAASLQIVRRRSACSSLPSRIARGCAAAAVDDADGAEGQGAGLERNPQGEAAAAAGSGSAERARTSWCSKIIALPQVTFQIIIPGAGGYFDPADKIGLASYTAALMREGTKTRTSPQISEALETMAASLNVAGRRCRRRRPRSPAAR